MRPGSGVGRIPDPTLGYMDINDLALLARARKYLADGTALRIREDAGIKRVEFAAAADVSVPALARWEHGLQVPRGEPALRYARALGALRDLIGAKEDGGEHAA